MKRIHQTSTVSKSASPVDNNDVRRRGRLQAFQAIWLGALSLLTNFSSADVSWTPDTALYVCAYHGGSRTRETIYRIERNRVKWHRESAGPSFVYAGPRVVLNVTPTRDTLEALDPERGTVLWTFRPKIAISEKLVVSNGRVFVRGESNQVICLDATRGALLWKVEGDHKITVSENRLCSETVTLDLICFDITGPRELWRDEAPDELSEILSAEKKLYLSNRVGVNCIDPSTGRTEWSKNFAYADMLALLGRQLIIRNDEGCIQSLDAATGDVHWRTPSLGSFVPIRVTPNFLLIRTEEVPKYVCLSLLNGRELWQSTQLKISTAEENFASFIDLEFGICLGVTADQDSVVALDAQTGQSLWAARADGKIQGVAATRKRFYAACGRTLVVLDPATGRRRGTLELDNDIRSFSILEPSPKGH